MAQGASGARQVIEYAVVHRDGMWCLFQCGQQIRVFDRCDHATQAAGELARLVLAPDVEVTLWVQSSTGELRRSPLGTTH